ncbi:phosphonate ABC transporter ATP-binding protein [Culicoidibacter larvae]|uniref:Phosphonate ABC transporter ATP-binding protein n=1 Tax=Culicoidibacter larvae TaxID=2579976 RepID=A0A5R8QDY0_9FIRM|nr:phosphonate ABC transporter ATP-binding protein [Culicoidibacter larvae]TLG75475.1 phosphonate ABC transporter ATP-binding protein [Culicoidibacter larvae]
MQKILELRNIKKVYNKTSIGLEEINLSFSGGEFVAVIGPSGAGKSTLLRCINRLIQPTSGEVIFIDREVQNASKKELRFIRSQIGMIFQHYNLIDRSSVLENVLLGRLGHMNPIKGLFSLYSNEDKENAIKLLRKIGLDEQIYKRADELSGGQKQRVGICRALIQQPKLMLADEPIASLDPKTSIDVMDALYNNCQDFGITCITNLHQVEVAKKYATRIIGVKKGKVVFDGKPNMLTEDIISMLYEGKEGEAYA